MEKTTNLRIGSYFNAIDKVCQIAQTRQPNAEELQNLRYTTSRILQLLLSQDKSARLAILKSPCHVQSLTSALELFSKDVDILRNLISTFSELVGRTGTSKHCAALVSGALTQTVFVMLRESKLDLPCDLLADVFGLLYKLGLRDKKRFGVKARLSQVLMTTLTFVRTFGHIVRVSQPALSVLKLYCLSSVNAAYLSKAGAVSVLFKVLTGASRKSTILLKTALDTLVLLVKSKSSAARAVNHDGVALLLRMHCDWQRLDTKNRHVGLRKAILGALRHLTDLKAGRRSFTAADGVRSLYRACDEIVDVRELESLVFSASIILRKCLPKHKLPASTNRSALTFVLPHSDLFPQVTGHGSASRAATRLSSGIVRADDGCNLCSSSEEEVDDDDGSSDDDVDLDTRKNESDDDRGEGAPAPPVLRPLDDLFMYETFFPELSENLASSLHDDGNQESAASTHRLAYSPHPSPFASVGTAAAVAAAPAAVERCAARLLPPLCLPGSSASMRAIAALQSGSSASYDVRGSEACAGSGATLMPLLASRGLPASISAPAALHSLGALGSGCRHDGRPSSSSLASDGRSGACSAVNAKTGLPVFSLDPPLWSRVPPVPTRGGSPAPRGGGGGSVQSMRSPSAAWHMASLSLLGDSSSSDAVAAAAAAMRGCGLAEHGSVLPPPHAATASKYLELAQKTLGVGPFVKAAFPDMHGHEPPPFPEPLYEKRFGTQRAKIFEDIDRMIEPETLINKVVYDLDAIIKSDASTYSEVCDRGGRILHNDDMQRIRKRQFPHECLCFNARFESGNLRKVIQVRDHEYDLILCPDVNTNHHHQWFYFEVGNMKGSVPYRFNIINNEKPNSQFNFGMQPVMFSVCEASEGRPYWLRTGSDVCYYKNHFARSARVTGGVRGKLYYTTTFTVHFPHSYDVCYLAYHYPYTYSTLQSHIATWERLHDSSSTFFRCQELCRTLRGNPVPLLTLTARQQTAAGQAASPDSRDGAATAAQDLATGSRPYVFLSARVHPGESNASWIMKGIVDYLLSDVASARALREAYVFKVVPMLNPDGVICGNHRSSLTGEDLNRRWLVTCPDLHPTVYHTKGLLQHLRLNLGLPLHVFCDLHGHSRRKNVFLYGCSPSLSWISEDSNNPTVVVSGSQRFEDASYKALPRLLASSAPAFSLSNCSYTVEKTKESTARVVVWRQLGVVRSYTMESTYCGCDQGPYSGLQINTKQLEEMGQRFAQALLRIKGRVVSKPASTASPYAAAASMRDGGIPYDVTGRPATGLEEPPECTYRRDLSPPTGRAHRCIVPSGAAIDKSDSDDDVGSEVDDNSESGANYSDYDVGSKYSDDDETSARL